MCTKDTSVEVTQNQKINITGEALDVICYKEQNGIVEADANGGVGTLVYSWDDPMNSTTDVVSNLPAGSYVVTVTDDLMCFDTLRFTIGEPDSLEIEFEIDGLLCFGDDIGSIAADVFGGNGGYTFEWNDPASQTDETASGLMEGLYGVTVTDRRGCQVSDTISLTEPEMLTLALDSTDILCNGDATGTINSTVGGGTPGYTYTYNGVMSSADPSSLIAGKYVLVVTDNNGCEITDSIVINQPTAIDIEANVTDIDCFGNINGAIDITASGGVSPFEFNWSSGQVIGDIADLSAGSYTLTVTDGNNCDVLKTEQVESPAEISASITPGNVLCFGEATGGASTFITGGTGGYITNWSNGAMTSDITSLAAGKYTLTIEDSNGCVKIDSTEITQPNDALTATNMTMDLLCFGDANGMIDIDASGGSAPYRYQLDNRPISNNSIFQGLSGGTYDVEVIDQNGCTFPIRDLTLFEPNEFIVNLGDNKIIELGVDTVQFNPSVSGGQGALMYEYSGVDLENLTCLNCPDPFIQGQVYTKEYTITVIDEQGCTATDNVRVIISKDRRVWVPTGFTPNTGNENDLLTPLGDPNTTVLNFQIFDRWGTLVFEQSDFQLGDDNFGWDGTYKDKELDPSVFVWKATVVYFEDGIEESFTGQTYLLR